MSLDNDPAALAMEFRRTLGMFVTGVTIVTTVDDNDQPQGMTANSFTSVSLDPPLVLVCIGKHARSYEAFNQARGFAVNVLDDDQRSLAEVFASSKVVDKFDHVTFGLGAGGAPVIHDSLAWLDCTMHQRVEAGDHIILIGEVQAFGANPGRPLAYCQGGFLSFEVQQEAIFQPRNKNVAVGCVANYEGRLLLHSVEIDGRLSWKLPDVAMACGESGGLGTLKRLFDSFGTTIKVSFIYSVYEDENHERVHLMYRGELTAPPVADDVRLFAESEVPWDDLVPPQVHPIVGRFFEEQLIDQFGVYVDLEEGGQVATISGKPRDWKSHTSNRNG